MIYTSGKLRVLAFYHVKFSCGYPRTLEILGFFLCKVFVDFDQFQPFPGRANNGNTMDTITGTWRLSACEELIATSTLYMRKTCFGALCIHSGPLCAGAAIVSTLGDSCMFPTNCHVMTGASHARATFNYEFDDDLINVSSYESLSLGLHSECIQLHILS